MPLSSGTRLGPYEIVSALGAGGMGEVYRASDAKLKREVALKVIPEAFASDPQRMARFEREAQVLASLNHPNIAAIYGLEESGSVRALVMELVEGPTLAERIAQGPIPLEEALPLAKQIAEALEYAHEHGIIHRDLKPANVKLTKDGTVKVLDFGLAKALTDDSSAGDISNSPTLSVAATKAGFILGTAAYMAPEQARGKVVDRRADIWSFGAVLFEMLSGKLAFHGETISDTLAAVIRAEPDWSQLPADTPRRIRELLQRCLQKEPRQRLQAIGEARIAVEQALGGEPSEVPMLGASETTWRRALPWAMAAVFFVALLGVVSRLWNHATPPAQPVVRLAIQLRHIDSFKDVAISPDGKHIAYTIFGGDTPDKLFRRDLDRFEDSTNFLTVQADSLFYSPDGKWLAYFANGHLMKIPVDGDTPQTICDVANGTGGSWGADGKILYADQGKGLYEVTAAGGEPSLLLPVSSGASAYAVPQILPGGRKILFTIIGSGNTPEVRVAAIGRERTRGAETPQVILQGASNAQYVAPGYLVYARGGELMAVPFDAERLKITGTAWSFGIKVRWEEFLYPLFGVSENGTLMYARANEGAIQRNLVWVNRKGEAQAIPLPPRPYADPNLSPDGSRLVVGIDEGTQNLWMYDFKRQTFTRLTFEQKQDWSPIWTRAGKLILFVSPGNPSALNLVPADGSGPEKPFFTFPSNSFSFPLSWTPDGKTLALQRSIGSTIANIDILRFKDANTLELDGGPMPLLTSKFNEHRPQFSPDGHYLAYVSDESGRPEIYVQGFPGPSGKWQVSVDGGDEARWSRDGRSLFYHVGTKMIAVSLQTKPAFSAGRPETLFEGDFEFPGGVINYDVAPDGQRFLMMKSGPQASAPEIDVVVNFIAEMQKQKVTEQK